MREEDRTVRNGDAVAVFPCALCGKEAGRVTLVPRDMIQPEAAPSGAPGGTLIVECFTGRSMERIPEEALLSLWRCLEGSHPRALYQRSPLWTPSYCPLCDLSYCGDHWQVVEQFDEDFPGFYDSSYGICPQGHRRLVDD